MEEPTILTGRIEAAGRLDKALAEASGLSRARIQQLIREGQVSLAGRITTSASQRLAGAPIDYRIAIPAPVPAAAQGEAIALDIVHEDEWLLVIDKPAGMVVHPAAGNRAGTLVNALIHHCRGELSGIGGVARPGIVHRIDKDTSGLLVVAKTDAAHEALARQFAEHSIARRYLALCAGHPSPAAGTIEGRIGRSQADRKKMAVLPPDARRGKHAITHYQTIERLRACALVECRLETGRTHQIRVHLASIGHALLGDPVYGRASGPLRPVLSRLGFSRQALHARSLGFAHPRNGQWMEFESPLPGDMRELIEALAH